MVEGRYLFSPSFFVDGPYAHVHRLLESSDFYDFRCFVAFLLLSAGYWFRLQAGRIRWERNDGFAFALFLSLDITATGKRSIFILSTTQGFVSLCAIWFTVNYGFLSGCACVQGCRRIAASSCKLNHSSK
jgi:hypothetical protein